jgi:hypothetical protein
MVGETLEIKPSARLETTTETSLVSRMSRHWVMRTSGTAQEEVRLWPAQWEAVLECLPHDPTQLAQAHAEAAAELQRISDLLASEFDDPAVS